MSSTSSQWGASFGADNLFCPSCQNILNAPDADQIMSCSYCTQDVSFSGSVDDMKQTKIINSAASQFEQDEAPSLHKRATVSLNICVWVLWLVSNVLCRKIICVRVKDVVICLITVDQIPV